MSALFAVACGGGQPSPETPETPPETPTAPPEPPPEEVAPEAAPEAEAVPPAPAKKLWSEMEREERLAHMKEVVLPKMKTVFSEHDPKEFADAKCTLCHGKGAEKGEFKMPNPKLPKLNPAKNFAKHVKEEPEMVKFMGERVVPEMAALLDMQPYDPATQKGFGCFNCHTQAK